MLDRARAELAAGDPAFYATLRDAWRACRCVEIADTLAELAQRYGRPPIQGKKLKEWQIAWVARVREENPLDLTNLMKGLLERSSTKHASLVASCLDELMRYADEPQLVRPLLRLLDIEPTSSAWNKVHTRIYKLLEQAGDPRAIEGLVPAIHMAEHQSQKWSDSMRESLARSARVRDKLRARFPHGVPAAESSTPEACDALLATTPAKPIAVVREATEEIEALFAAIVEEPTDDARRAVYADALQQRGDPRGEVIAMQLAGKPLTEKHRRIILGGIAKTVSAITAEFEKGFLVSDETDVRRASQADVVFGREEWATVKRLTFRGYGALTPAMRSLEEAYGVPEQALVALRSVVLPRLRVLEVGQNASRGSFDVGLAAGRPVVAASANARRRIWRGCSPHRARRSSSASRCPSKASVARDCDRGCPCSRRIRRCRSSRRSSARRAGCS